MATYTVDKISYGGNTYNLQDAGALQLTGGSVTGPVTFGDSVSIDDLSAGTLSVTGGATFTNNIQANKINNVTVGSSPKFTDTITTVSTTGSGNAITSITASNGAITATKGSTFLTSSDVSGKIDTAGTGLSKSGTTLNHSNSVTAQTTQAVYPIKIDAQGHISAYGTAVTIPSDVNVTSTAVTAATTNYITGSTTSTTTTGTLSKHASAVMYTTADSGTSGYTQLRLGNTTATTSAGGKEGQIRLYGTNATYYLDLKPGAIASSNKTITFPNATGTVALTSDIPTVPTITLNGSSTTSPSFYAPTGAGTSGQYLKSSGTGAPTWTNFPTIPSITLNGSSTTSPSFYAPTGAGTSGQYLKSNGSGAPSWTNFPTIPSITLNGSTVTSPSFYAPSGAGTSGQYLKSSGTGAPYWANFPTIPTVPSAGSSASAVGTSASGGSATTWSKSDHVHNITSTTITTALGYTPYNSTNPNGYTSNVGTVTGVKVNGTTINPTSGVVDIGTVATSDTKVTQNIISSDDANSYPLLLSASTDGSTATTETALKCGSLTFIRNDDNANALSIGAGRVILGRIHFNSNETTRSSGTGIGIGTGDSSDSELFYRTAGSGQFLMQHYTAAKNSDGTIPSGVYRDSIINMNTSANNPTIYLYNKSGADTVTSYLRLNANSLYIHDKSAHQLGADGIDKVNALGTSTTICKTQHYTTALTSNTWYTFDSFTLAAGTWIVQCSATFNSTSSTGTRIIRLTTGNTSTTRVNWSCEATLGAHANSMNTLTFTTILTPTASTTYYLRAWSSINVDAHATNNSGFVTYTRLI